MAAEAVAKALAKPQLRGLLTSSIKKHLIVCGVLSTITAVVWKMTIYDGRKNRYADFYKNYDAQAEYERMKAAGVFQSAQ